MSDSGRRVMIENLESRTLHAAAVTATCASKALRVTGTAAADTLSVRLDGKVVRVVDLSVPGGRTVCEVAAKRVGAVFFNGGRGADELRVDFNLHNSTITRAVESRRVYLHGGKRLTHDFASEALPGVYENNTDTWIARHRAQIDALTPADKKADVLLLGDSMAERFRTTGKKAYASTLAPRHTVDLGLTGDTTAQVLYRIEDGLLDGFSPKAVVLIIGTNNLNMSDATNSVIGGIRAVVRAINARLPNAKVVLNGIFPTRSEVVNHRAAEVNARMATWADGDRLRFLDVTEHFASSPVRQDLYRPADLHLNAKGYRLWASLLAPALDDVLTAT